MDKKEALETLQGVLSSVYRHMPSGDHLSDMAAHIGGVEKFIKSVHEPAALEEPEICCFHSNTPNKPIPLSEAQGNYSERNTACRACGDCRDS